MSGVPTRRPQQPKSVCEDWIAWLPAEKQRVFDATQAQLEIPYTMLSVALNEALTLRAEGSLFHAREEAGVTPDLFDRLAAQMLIVLRAIEEQAQNLAVLPNVTPLVPENFRGAIAHRVSRKSNLLDRLLSSNRTRFSHKIRCLAQAAEELALGFRECAKEVASGNSVSSILDWDALDTFHYDMNTCLREAVIILKSFLIVLPEEDIRGFHLKLFSEPNPSVGDSRTRFATFRHRRATVISRKYTERRREPGGRSRRLTHASLKGSLKRAVMSD